MVFLIILGGGTAPIITDLTNTGIISAEAIGDDEAYGIYNDEGTITNLTNTGTISGTEYDVGSWKTNSHIVNFNNLQSALTYNDRLPRNYSTIIQGNNYGQLFIEGTPTESTYDGYGSESLEKVSNIAKKYCQRSTDKPQACLLYSIQNKDGTVNILWETSVREYEQEFGAGNNSKTTEPSPDDNKVVAAASGSGFFVSNTGHIITNHHVIDECKAVKVNFKGDEIEAKILAIDKTNDLAILKANINPSKVFAISNEDVSLLQDIIVAGFPLGKRVSAAIKTHKGSVSALAGFGDNYSNFQTDATINQGNSGGPVMDHKGNIVGVAVALMSAEAGQNIFFAVKSSTLKTFANSNGITFLPANNREMSNAELGQLITEGTLFLECWMTVAKIKQIIAQEENRKAFYSEHQ